MLLYEHKTRSDGCVEEVSIGLLLAQKGLANCSDYEKATYEESGSGESEDKTLEFQESELQFTPEDSDTNAESKNSSSVDLLEKILAPKASFAPAKQQLLKPTELTTKTSDQTTHLHPKHTPSACYARKAYLGWPGTLGSTSNPRLYNYR